MALLIRFLGIKNGARLVLFWGRVAALLESSRPRNSLAARHSSDSFFAPLKALDQNQTQRLANALILLVETRILGKQIVELSTDMDV